MPSSRPHRHRVEIVLTQDEYEQLSANAYSREISRGELVRRALKEYTGNGNVEAIRPPKSWRMGRASV